MKDQVKSRMEVLLQQEIEARQLSTTASSKAAQTSSNTGRTSSFSSTTSQTGSGSVTRNRDAEKLESKVNTKADLVFNMDSGKITSTLVALDIYCVCNWLKEICVWHNVRAIFRFMIMWIEFGSSIYNVLSINNDRLCMCSLHILIIVTSGCLIVIHVICKVVYTCTCTCM